MTLSKRIVQWLKFIAFLSVGILLLWLAFRNVDFRRLSEDIRQADYSWIMLSLVLGFAAFASRARRWMLLINPLGHKPGFWNTYNALMTGYLANIALPRIGEITRCVALGRKEKLPVDQLIGTVVAERTIDFFSLLFITIIVLFSAGSQIKRFLMESIFIPLREKIAALFGFTWILWLVLAALSLITIILLLRYRKELRKSRFFSKLFDTARGIINGLKTITSLRRKWEFIFHTFFIWLNYTLMTWLVAFALESTSGLSFFNAVFILVIGGLAMTAPVQSGIGIFHYTVSRGIALAEGVSLEDGLSYAIFTHESQLIYILVTGAISFFLIFGRSRKVTEAESLPQ